MAAPGASGPDELPIDVELIKVLASDSRRDILRMLADRRKTLTELAAALDLKKATVLEHLQKLVAAGLIRKLDEDERLWIYYELTPRGKRLVRPERTRFYLILGGTAAAALLLGVVIAASVFLGGFGSEGSMPSQAGEDATSLHDAAGKAFDARETTAPQTAWRGLDERVDIRLGDVPDDATLVLRGSRGDAYSFEIRGGVATLDATRIDPLPADQYALSLAGPEGEAALARTLVVRDPAIAVFPRVVTAGENATLEVSLAPPGYAPPPNATVRVDDVEHRLVGQSVAFLPFVALDTTRVDVGRYHSSDVIVAPAFAFAVSNENVSLRARVTEGGSPVVDAQISIDGALLGKTNSDGVLVAPWPAPGDRALRVVASDGRAHEIGALFDATTAVEIAPRLRIGAFDARLPEVLGLRIRADVFNDGPAAVLVTLAAREGGALLASAPLSVPAHGHAEALLESSLASPQVVDVTAHGASASASVAFRARSPPAAGAPAPQTATGSAEPSYEYDTEAYADPTGQALARDTLVLAPAVAPSATVGQTVGPSAKVPDVPTMIIVALVALLAFALRARRR